MGEEVIIGGTTAVSSKIPYMCAPGSKDTQSQSYQRYDADRRTCGRNSFKEAAYRQQIINSLMFRQ